MGTNVHDVQMTDLPWDQLYITIIAIRAYIPLTRCDEI